MFLVGDRVELINHRVFHRLPKMKPYCNFNIRNVYKTIKTDQYMIKVGVVVSRRLMGEVEIRPKYCKWTITLHQDELMHVTDFRYNSIKKTKLYSDTTQLKKLNYKK